MVFLSTAHPCKFPEVFPPEIAAKIDIPSQVDVLKGHEKDVVELGTDYREFKTYLISTQ